MTNAPTKSAARARARASLAALSPERRAAASAVAAQHLIELPQFQSARSIMLFSPLSDEPDIAIIAQAARAALKTIALPRINWASGTMAPARFDSASSHALVLARLGLREPPPDAPTLPVSDLDLILVPGLAFSLDLGRLGRGKGFYDRFLSSPDCRALKVGITFEEQISPTLPMDMYDVRMDFVVTDTRLIGPATDTPNSPP